MGLGFESVYDYIDYVPFAFFSLEPIARSVIFVIRSIIFLFSNQDEGKRDRYEMDR